MLVRRTRVPGFTLTELLVVVAILAMLGSLLTAVAMRAMHGARRTKCLSNLHQFVLADIQYYNDLGALPDPSGFIPSSVTVDRLRDIASRMRLDLPKDAPAKWPKRPKQPDWINCPMAKTSGFAEGLVLGGGLYTGYGYFGGIESSFMVKRGLAKLPDPEHIVDRKNSYRGVMWADVLTEYRIGDSRRFEIFHVTKWKKYSDFRFHADEIDGMHRGWSDGSVEWVPVKDGQLGGKDAPQIKVKHSLGNFYL